MAKVKPQRIQRKRTKGWRMPANTVYVGWPSKWANPFRMGCWIRAARYTREEARLLVAALFTECLLDGDEPNDPGMAEAMDRIKADIHELRNKSLACWCPLDQPCHADTLLELANRPESEGR